MKVSGNGRGRAKAGLRKPLEQEIKRQIVQYLKLSKCFCWVNSSVGIYDAKRGIFRNNRGIGALNGVADILGIWKQRPLAIEVKRPGGRVSEEQKAFIEEFRVNGGIAFIAYSLDDVIQALSK